MTTPKAGDLPAPLTPSDCDLRGLPYMPLDVIRLLDSDMFAETTGDEFKAAVALWCKSWTQVPAASLPNKDMVLAHLSGNAAKWKRIKEGAMRGWILCSDDRWYHPVVAEKALAALPGREEFNHKKSADAERKAREREDRKALFEVLRSHGVVPDWNVPTKALRALAAQHLSQKPPSHVTDDERDMSQPVTVSKGEKKGELTSKTLSSSSQASNEVGVGKQPDDDDKPGNRETEIASLLRQQGLDANPADNLVRMTWAPDPRVTDDVLLVSIAKAKKFKPGEDIPLSYLDKAVQSVLQRQSAQAVPYSPAVQAAPPAPLRKPEGNEPKGTDESYDEWQARVDAFERAQRGRAA